MAPLPVTVTVFSVGLSANACLPIVLTPFPMVTEVRLLFWNACLPIVLTPFPMVTEVRLLFWNALSSITVTE